MRGEKDRLNNNNNADNQGNANNQDILDNAPNANVAIPRVGYFNNRAVFNAEQENLLVNYLLKASGLYYGLSMDETRKLAYEYANRLGVEMPPSWIENEKAGKDWLQGFMKRQPEISLRAPEATSLSRATSFNKYNVGKFFDNLQLVIEREGFTPEKIFNLDETGCTTVQKPDKDHFINGAPPGTVGAAHQSGWMTELNFLQFMKHFVAHVRCSPENKVLLLLDNHDSHISIETLDYAKENGIVMLSFPPHCSHKLQPLDRSVYGPFKRYYNTACDGWITENKGKTMTIYDIPALVGKAFPRAMIPTNIQSGFRRISDLSKKLNRERERLVENQG
ncbi:PREDICTED: uncharacterized protein LOC106807207 [Priapulus caudatus]|uniref:Uncharacterized protein LOC106807207 n=1 Tax=Priapulus caudatus TaxID=37621 RepID=A0ABM1DYF7_PRICU|nr:PREDICTED: uncharacterized protein LOC106807207 [Priapulus caudatus]